MTCCQSLRVQVGKAGTNTPLMKVKGVPDVVPANRNEDRKLWFWCGYLCCDLAEHQLEVGSIDDCEIYPEKECISFVFYCSENPSIAHNFGTTSPIQVEFSPIQISQLENWKCHMLDFRLISLDHITFFCKLWVFHHMHMMLPENEHAQFIIEFNTLLWFCNNSWTLQIIHTVTLEYPHSYQKSSFHCTPD